VRRFSNSLCAVDGVWIVASRQDLDVELLWEVLNTGNLVIFRSIEKFSVFAVKVALFLSQPRETLNETSFDLSNVNGRIDGSSNVLKSEALQKSELSSEAINFHFRKTSCESEVFESVNFDKFRIEYWAVVSISSERDTHEVSHRTKFLESCIWLLDHLLHSLKSLDDLVTCLFHSTTFQLSSNRSSHSKHVGGLFRRSVRLMDVFDRNSERFGSDLCEFDVNSLSEFNCIAGDKNCSVRVAMDESVGLMEDGC